jgi:hypothetical protein
VLDQLADLRRRRLVDAPAAPVLGDAVPVGAVGPAAARADQGGYDRDVVRECRRGRPCRRGGQQVRGRQAHPLQHEHRRGCHGRVRCACPGARSGDRHCCPPSRDGNGMCAPMAWWTSARE